MALRSGLDFVAMKSLESLYLGTYLALPLRESDVHPNVDDLTGVMTHASFRIIRSL